MSKRQVTAIQRRIARLETAWNRAGSGQKRRAIAQRIVDLKKTLYGGAA